MDNSFSTTFKVISSSLFLWAASHGSMEVSLVQTTPPKYTSDEIVEKLLKQKEEKIKEQKSRSLKSPLKSPFPSNDAQFNLYREHYPVFEANIKELKKEWPIYSVAGGLSYLMSLKAMKHVLTKKFADLYRNGQILTRKEFETYKKDEWLSKGNDLTRMWGAEYLAEKGVHVPQYIIVLNDNEDDLSVQIKLAKCNPIVNLIDNGTLYAQTIAGTKERGYGTFGYTDTGSASLGNVIRTPNGSDYFVDTEYKSFYDSSPGKEVFGQKYEDWSFLCEFLEARFELLNDLPPLINMSNSLLGGKGFTLDIPLPKGSHQKLLITK